MNKLNTKGLAIAEVIIVSVLIILLTFMAVPAFQKVRETSQKKAILSNLRLLAKGASEYFEEHGVMAVHQNKLIGPGKYIEELVPLDGEVYPRIIIQGTTFKVTTKSNLEVTVSF